jgi:hypothetical protein
LQLAPLQPDFPHGRCIFGGQPRRSPLCNTNIVQITSSRNHKNDNRKLNITASCKCCLFSR